jgi:hypothetical protein
MNTTNITPYPAPDLVKNNWEFTEVWIEPMLAPPYILLLLSDKEGNCQIYDPALGYKIVFASSSYEEAQNWLLEDEYERVESRFLAEYVIC